tara:strand:- start:1813 stop:2172 length:360 start_codon:yes stop_codon:yes gene_type:complete
MDIDCPSSYDEVTMLGEGCSLTLEGGGLLYTKAADAAVYSEMEMANMLIAGLKVEIGTCISTLNRVKDEHLIKITSLSQLAKKDIKDLKSAHKGEMLNRTWVAFTAGVAVGLTVFVVAR